MKPSEALQSPRQNQEKKKEKTHMESFVNFSLPGLELGEPQAFENMAVFPLISSLDGGPAYVTLKEALDSGALVITEVSQGGSVPDLMAENKGDIAVLILDGEEVCGAKQNRILNTTILVGPKSSVKIPVSCTEHGRWHYVSPEFAASGHVMSPSLRSHNMRNVHASLACMREFRSDQGQVWDDIANLSARADVRSSTGAMKDVHDAKKAQLDDYLKEFKVVSGQSGLLVFIDGKPAGLDFISRAPAFGLLFPKLVKSFALEAMIAGDRGSQDRRRNAKTGGAELNSQPKAPTADHAKSFLSRAASSEEKTYNSVGLGISYRYSGANIVGSALALDAHAVHVAFFQVTDADKAGNMAGMSHRRTFRL
jgi:hypothetical protein